MGVSALADDVLALLERTGFQLVRHEGMTEQWKLGNVILRVPGRRYSSAHNDNAWRMVKQKVRRAALAAGVEVEIVEGRKKNEAVAPAPQAVAPQAVAKLLQPALPQRGQLPDGPVDAARALSEHSLWLAGACEEFEERVRAISQGRAACEAARFDAEERCRALQKQLDTKGAELAAYNGRDWPKELEAAVAQRKTAQARVVELEAQVAHLKSALRSLTLADEKKT